MMINFISSHCNTFLALVFFLMPVYGVADPVSDVFYTKDGRMGSQCFPSRFVKELEEECEVTLDHLVLRPEIYDKRGVKVEGFFVSGQELNGLVGDRFKLWLEGEKKLFSEKYNNKKILVYGVYDALSFGHLDTWDGALKVYKIRVIEEK